MNKEYMVFSTCVQGNNSIDDLEETFDFNISDVVRMLLRNKHVEIRKDDLIGKPVILPTEEGMDFWNEYCESCECNPCDCSWGIE